jgi:hypothetical protein
MTFEWFVVRDGKEQGPYSTQRLKQMAADGKLRPEDLVRRTDTQAPRRASTIKGLFPVPEEEAPSAASQRPNRSSEGSMKKQGGERQNRTKTKMSKKNVIIIASAASAMLLFCCGGLGFLFFLGTKQEKATRAELAEADEMWKIGDKAGAATKYERIVDGGNAHWLKEADRPRLYGRLIDFRYEKGDAASGMALIDKADKDGITPEVSHADAKSAIAAIRTEKSRVPSAKNGVSKKGRPSTDAERPSKNELIQLLAKSAVAVASEDNTGANTGPDDFTNLMRSAARELGAEKHEDTRSLLQIEPTSQKEFVTPQGIRGLVLRYGEGSQTSATFSKNPKTGRWQLFMAQFGDEEWTPFTGLRKKK